LPSSKLDTEKPLASKCVIQSLQQPHVGLFQTSMRTDSAEALANRPKLIANTPQANDPLSFRRRGLIVSILFIINCIQGHVTNHDRPDRIATAVSFSIHPSELV
jgi:hypothetical protein